MAIGRISGPMLYSNLERQGVDLAFESNILYLDVNNRWVGANTSTPNAELQVVGTANLANITIAGNTISSVTGQVDFGSNANVYISGGTSNQVLLTDGAGNLSWGTVSELTTGFGNVQIAGNTISILEVDGNLELTANGTGIVTTLGYTFYAANIVTTGGASGNISGVNYLLSTGVKSTGNITADYFIGNVRSTEIITSGNITADYFIGNVTAAAGGNISATFFTGNLDGTTVNTTGNVTAGNLVGNVYSTTVIVGGNVTANYFVGNVSTDGNVTAGNLVGNVYSTTIITNTVTSNLFIGNSATQQITSNIGDLHISAATNDPNNIIRFDSVSALDIAAGTTAQRPPNPDSGFLRYNSDVGSIEWWNGVDWIAGAKAIATQTISPNGVDTVYTLDQASTAEGVLVNINGTMQQPGSAYTIVDDQITFTSIPETTDIIEVRFLTSLVAGASFLGGNVAGAVHITNTAVSSSTTTGALVVDGGTAIVGNINVGGNVGLAATAGTPGNTSSPASWLKVYVGGTAYFMPLYQ